MRRYLKKYVNISDIHLLNISKISNLDIQVLKTASSALNEIYKEAEDLGKSSYSNFVSQGYRMVLLCSIFHCRLSYFIYNCQMLINKCINIFKLCCVPKKGCVQYFKCFNNNVKTYCLHIRLLRDM